MSAVELERIPGVPIADDSQLSRLAALATVTASARD
jgi:hypothetical protein